jgi:hypothetical protein
MSGCTAEMYIQRSAGGTTVVLVGNDAPAQGRCLLGALRVFAG